jgi:hypothetical protein
MLLEEQENIHNYAHKLGISDLLNL